MKYVKVSISLLLLLLYFYSCTEPVRKEDPSSSFDKEDVRAVNFLSDSLYDAMDLTGIYQGKFPCLDCNGMEQILFLKSNHTYKQAYVNVDSNKVFSTSNGDWKIQNNQIVLSKNNDYCISFEHRDDSLYAVDIDGINIRNPELYVLGKKDFAGDIRNWKSEIKNGITFAGRGMDPGWVMNIKNNIIYFKLHDQKKVLVAEKEAIERDEHATTYHLTTDNKSWTVTIKDIFCKNGMSDDMYEYEVMVNYNGNIYQGCGIDLKKN